MYTYMAALKILYNSFDDFFISYNSIEIHTFMYVWEKCTDKLTHSDDYCICFHKRDEKYDFLLQIIIYGFLLQLITSVLDSFF